MQSLFFLKCFFQTFTSLALALTFVGNSLSLTCHICKEGQCTTKKCLSYLTSIGLGSTIACATVFIVDPPGRLCVPEEPWVKLTGGERNGCKEVRGEEYAKVQQEIQNKSNEAFAAGIVPQDQIDEMEEAKEQSQEQSRQGQGQASATTIKVCSCNTDLCKFDGDEKMADKKEESKKDDKGAEGGTSSINGMASSFLERKTNVMFVSLGIVISAFLEFNKRIGATKLNP